MTPPDQTPSARRGLAVFAVALALMTAACTGGAVLTTASPAPTSPTRPTPTATAVATAGVAPAESTPIPIWTGPQDRVPGAPGQCSPSGPCQFTAGTYQTYGRWAFLPGLAMYIPDGWTSTEQDAGEFNLQNSDFPDGSGLFFWRDVIPVEPDGTRLATVPSTVAGMRDWLRADPQLVVTDPREKVIGKGLDTTTFVVEVADGAVNNVPECAAVKATCFPILMDPGHWDGTWNVASTESSRYYLATIGPVSNRHLLVVAVVTQTSERLRFEKAVAPILDSLDVSRVTFN